MAAPKKKSIVRNGYFYPNLGSVNPCEVTEGVTVNTTHDLGADIDEDRSYMDYDFFKNTFGNTLPLVKPQPRCKEVYGVRFDQPCKVIGMIPELTVRIGQQPKGPTVLKGVLVLENFCVPLHLSFGWQFGMLSNISEEVYKTRGVRNAPEHFPPKYRSHSHWRPVPSTTFWIGGEEVVMENESWIGGDLEEVMMTDSESEDDPNDELAKQIVKKKRANSAATCLFSAMSRLLKDSDTADFTLICGDKVWKLHSPVLAARSPIFRAEIANNKANKLEMKMEVRDRDPEAMQEVIKFVYGVDENITKENVLEMGKIAESYDIEKLVQKLAMFIVKNGIEMKEEDLVPKLTVNVLHIFKHALKHSKDALKLEKKESVEALKMSKDLTSVPSQLHEVDYPIFPPPDLSADSCLLGAMAHLLHDSDTADFTLTCGEKEWKLHSPILARRSVFFRAAILRRREMEMEIKELDPEAMLQMINFMYGHPIGEAPLESLLEASERFQMVDMKEEVIKVASENVSEENVLEIRKLAEFYDIKQLLEETEEFIVKNNIEMKEEDMVPKLEKLKDYRREGDKGKKEEDKG